MTSQAEKNITKQNSALDILVCRKNMLSLLKPPNVALERRATTQLDKEARSWRVRSKRLLDGGPNIDPATYPQSVR
jgi:hypothetical protein